MPKKYQPNLNEFSQLKLANNSDSGKKLVELFDNLGIIRASINKLHIEGWFDTECEATKEMLEWFSQYVDENNVLTDYENYRYKELCQHNQMLSDKHYDAGLSQLMLEKPGILDYEDNCLEIEYLEEELEMDLLTKHRNDQVLTLHEMLETKLLLKVNSIKEEEIAHGMKRNKVHEDCTQLSIKLDESHEKLQIQMKQLIHQINQYYDVESNFLIKSCSTNLDTFHKLPPLDSFLRRECDAFPQLNTTTKSAKKRLLQESNLNSSNELEVLKHKIEQSIQKYVSMQATNKAIEMVVNFYNNLNLHSFVTSCNSMDFSSQMSTESNIISHEMAVENRFDVIKTLGQAIAEGLITNPKLNTLQNTKHLKQQKLDRIKLIDEQVTRFVKNQFVLYLLVKKEINDIQRTDLLFKDIYYYITTVLHSCRLRIDEMMNVTKEYKLLQQLPLEEITKLFHFQRQILLENCNDSTSLLDLKRNFSNECQKVEQQIFIDDFNIHRSLTKNLEKQVVKMKEILVTGPTSQIVIVPGDLCNYFDQINDSINSRGASVKHTVQLINDAEKKLSKLKWFKIKRQLWMWFLVEPKTMLAAIKQLETSIDQKGNQK